MNVLLGCNHLHEVGGSEQHLFYLAKGFKELGYNVYVILGNFTLKGMMSDRLKTELDIEVDNIPKSVYFDAVFLSHTTTVKRFIEEFYNRKDLRFNVSNMYQICHGIFHSIEKPYAWNLLNYVAISEEVRDSIVSIVPKQSKVFVVRNPIDTNYFYPTNNLNEKPQSLFSLSQNDNFNNMLKRVCSELGMTFTKNNKHTNPSLDVRQNIYDADIVVSLGRGVYEAMSMCKNVIIADSRGYMNESLMDGMVADFNDFFEFIKNNCSGRFSKKQVTKKSLLEEIEKYNPSQGSMNRTVIERFFSHKKVATQLATLQDKTP